MARIYLVDDSTTMLMSLKAILEKAGHQVRTAPDGRKGLELVRKEGKPDLVITDLNMPGMDGITMIRELRKIPAMRFTPILMLTTESQQAKRQEAKKAGATGWLVKPVSARDLLGVLQRVLPRAGAMASR